MIWINIQSGQIIECATPYFMLSRTVQTGIHPESGALRMQYRSRTFKGVRTAIYKNK